MGTIFSQTGASSGSKRKYKNKKNLLQYTKNRIIQNFTLVWLDSTINEADNDCQYTLTQLRKVVNAITTCTDSETCQRLIERTTSEQIFLVVSGALGATFIPQVHHFIRLDSIYIFCRHPTVHVELKQKWSKIRVIDNQIETICEALAQDAAICEYDLIPTSILSLNDCSSQDLNQVEPSFMYTQLLKDILLEVDYEEKVIDVLVNFCRQHFKENPKELENINKFEKEYRSHTPIWWYTLNSFIYQLLNRSLRTLDIDIIAAMGFFLKQLHQQIKEEYMKRSNLLAPFIVYRGQGMPTDEFDKLRKNIGGLISFNSFLSTTTVMDCAVSFSQKRLNELNKIPILYIMEINPILTKTPFTRLAGLSKYPSEEEILFSMHTIFQIVEVKENDKHIWEIKLKSVKDNDPQITKLTEQMKRELGDDNAIDQLGRLMIKIGDFEKAEAFYELLLDATEKMDEKSIAVIYSQLGYINYKKDDQQGAKFNYEQAIEIQEKLRPLTDLNLATTYNFMGLWYTNANDSSNALKYHEKALAIQEKYLNHEDPDLASTYNNIGLVCYERRDYEMALSYYEKTRKIYEKKLPKNHPWLATAHKNIGLAQISIGKQQEGLDNLLTAMSIRKKSLPENHPSMASILSTIGGVYKDMNEYANALNFYEQAFEIETKSSNSNYVTLADAYYNMSVVLQHLQRHDQAIQYAQLCVEVVDSLPPPSTHPHAQLFKNNLEQLKNNTPA